MPWALTNYLQRRAKDMPASPKVLVFGSMFSAFGAGAQLIHELGAGHRTPLAIVLGCLMIAVWVAMSLECAYFLLRAVRR